MFRSIRQRVRHSRARRQARVPLDVLLETILAVRTRSDAIAITPTITGNAWMGVNRATHALFPDSVLDLPTVFGAPVCSDGELDDICRYISGQGFTQVILSGFSLPFASLAKRLRDHGMKVGCMYHGFLAECDLSQQTSRPIKVMLELCRDGVIAKLASNKKGLPETIRRLTGLNVHKFMVPTRVAAVSADRSIRTGREGCHIGVLAHDTFRKNIHNQVAAALMIEGATVHVAGRPEVDYWGCDHRLVYHPKTMPHHDYVGLLGQMDVNLHLSFSESWGQLTAESLAMGVPCLIANHSDIYDYDPLLRERLVSPHFDDPLALAGDVARVIEERHALADRCRQYVGTLNRMADVLLKEFLEA